MATHTIELNDEAEARLQHLLTGGYAKPSTAMEDALESLQADLAYDKQVQDFRAVAELAFAEAAGPDAIVLNTDEDLLGFMDGIWQDVVEEHEGRARTAA